MLQRIIDALVHDARHAVRSMRRTPGLIAVAILMIAIGTGANAAMFSVIDAVMLRSPFSDPDRLAMVAIRRADGTLSAALSPAQYRSLAESAPVFDALAVLLSGQTPILTGLGEPRRFSVECFTADMFAVLGTQPLAGRAFTRDDDRPDAPAVVVLSYDFWRRSMAGSPDAVGKVVSIDGTPTMIVGVMPRGFGGPYSRNTNDGWMPGGPALAGAVSPACSVRAAGHPFARVKAGLSLDAAARQASEAAGISHLEDWQGHTGGRLHLVSLQEQTTGDLRMPLLALLGAVGLVLLIACANVANLQMERIFRRRFELGVRMALGATRSRLVRQTLVENLLLSLAGAVAGIALAAWTLRLLVVLLPASMPHVNEIALTPRILLATLTVACLCAVMVGLLPAVQGTGAGLMNVLRASTRTAPRGAGWTRRALVVAQIALSLTLLVGAALMIATFQTLRPTNPGFNPVDKSTVSLRLHGAAAENPNPFYVRLFARLAEQKGVRAVLASTYVPMSGMVNMVPIRVAQSTQDVWTGGVTPNYFREMEIPAVRGRAFEPRDNAAATKVAVVNEAFAKRFSQDGNGLGDVVDIEFYDQRQGSRQIVGVVRDTRSAGSNLKVRPEIYVPLAQTTTAAINVIVRASRPGDPQLADAMRAALASIDPTQVIDRIEPMQDLLDSRVANWRFGAWLLGLFAAIALLLAAVGLAAAMAWWVTQRTREIGVRMALGANPRHVAGMVLAQGLALAGAGIAIGLACAAASTRLLEGWLFGISPLDRPTFAACAAAMLIVASLATYVPVRRATRIDPLVALRE